MEKMHLAALAAAIAAVESVLILFAILPPISSYSPLTIAFMLSRLLVIAYAGWLCAKDGLKAAAYGGAIVSASSTAVFIFAAAIGRSIGVPVLGIPAPDLGSLILILAISAAINILLGAFLATIAAIVRLKTGAHGKHGKAR